MFGVSSQKKRDFEVNSAVVQTADNNQQSLSQIENSNKSHVIWESRVVARVDVAN